uniref:Acyl-CoA thioesterase 8 n=1 Tax=Pseudonaja textilis TaxID=8673 RepID=A0A670ZSD5_PSETE
MSEPRTSEQGPEPAGDLRSVLLTSVLQLEPLDVDLFRDPNLLERYRQRLQGMLAQEVPIEMKPVNPPDFFHQNSQEPKQLFWVRAKGYLGECDMKLHCCVAAYISDYAFLRTALLPHQHHTVTFLVSLDHTMWFHAPFRADQWMLYECESPWPAFVFSPKGRPPSPPPCPG